MGIALNLKFPFEISNHFVFELKPLILKHRESTNDTLEKSVFFDLHIFFNSFSFRSLIRRTHRTPSDYESVFRNYP